MDRTIILGASRGLGLELAKRASAAGASVTGVARKPPREAVSFEFVAADFARAEGQERALALLQTSLPTRVFYVAGGGPYGLFHEREWKDHQWAFEVGFLFPARVAHLMRKNHPSAQLIFVGSAVAENAADPKAASYSAAKHALRGLVTTLRAENTGWDVRLFSPGYIDTDMLPHNAAVRKKGVYSPQKLAQELWDWTLRADDSGHRLYPVHPD